MRNHSRALLAAFTTALLLPACVAEQTSPDEHEAVGETSEAIGNGVTDPGNQFPFVGQFSYMGHGCSGTLITPSWLLTANHCITGSIDLSSIAAYADHTDSTALKGDTTIYFGVQRGTGISARHTFAKSGPVKVRMLRMVRSDRTVDSAMDLALIKLDEPVRGIKPLHPPLSVGACGGSDLEGNMVGYGPTSSGGGDSGTRRSQWSTGWDREDAGSGESVFANFWSVFKTYQGSLPGDSGGLFLKDDKFLCGVISRHYPKVFPPSTGADVAAGDSPNNLNFILSNVLRSGGFDGEGRKPASRNRPLFGGGGFMLSPPAPYDFDGDGKSDILWRNVTTGEVSIWKMDGSTPVSMQTVGAAGLEWQIDAVADVDGDYQGDLIWRNRNNGDVSIWFMNGTRIKSTPLIRAGVGNDWRIEHAGDFNGDGYADLLWRNVNSGAVVSWFMRGASVISEPTFHGGMPPAWQIQGAAHFDGDSRADILWRNIETGEISEWLMNGATVRATPRISPYVPGNWVIESLGDVDNDSKADIIWRNMDNGDVSTWLLNGATIRGMPMIRTGVDLNWEIIGTSDARGRRASDIVWRYKPNGRMAQWWLNGSIVEADRDVSGAVGQEWQPVR